MRIPKLCRHKASGRGYVRTRSRLTGHRETVYLGAYGTPECERAYRAWVSRYVAERDVGGVQLARLGLVVDDLVWRFWNHAKTHYRKDGEPTTELANYRAVLRRLRHLHGERLIDDVGPRHLREFRSALVDEGLARKTCNDHTARVVRVFAWAVSEELARPETLVALRTVDALRAGRTSAPEAPPRQTVPRATIRAIAPHCPPPVRAILHLLWVTGMRAGEVCSMRGRDLELLDDGRLEYAPGSHKTQHHGHRRVVALGRRARWVLRGWLRDDPDAYLFQPAEAVAWSRRRDRERRGLGPGPRGELDTLRGRCRPCYTPEVLRRAVHRACDRAGVERFRVHSLRHTYAERVRRRFDVEHVQSALGHATRSMAEHYAPQAVDRAHEVAKRLG